MNTLNLNVDRLTLDTQIKILDRLQSQHPALAKTLTQELNPTDEVRFNQGEGWRVARQGEPVLEGVLRQVLSDFAARAEREFKENPSVAQVKAHDFVLFKHVFTGQEDAKDTANKIKKQVEAVETSGAIAALVLVDIEKASQNTRQRVGAVLAAHRNPRLTKAIEGESLTADLGPGFQNYYPLVIEAPEAAPRRQPKP